MNKPYGTWDSPVTVSTIANQKKFNDVRLIDDGVIWVEGRGGKTVLCVQFGTDAPIDITADVNVGGGVGYGGGEFDVHGDLVVFASRDGKLYQVRIGEGDPTPFTPKYGKVASPAISPCGTLVAYVHTDGKKDVIAIVPLDGSQWPQIVAQGADFYMQPTFSPDGDRLAWIAWDHPNMPWDTTRLQLAKRDAQNAFQLETTFKNGAAIQQPQFSPNGKHLAYLSDESDFWQLYVGDMNPKSAERIPIEGDLAGPPWIQGLRTYDWASDTKLSAVSGDKGVYTLVEHTLGGETKTIVDNYTFCAQPSASQDRVAFVGSAPNVPPRVVVAGGRETTGRRPCNP